MRKKRFRCHKRNKGTVARLINSRVGQLGTFYMTYRGNSEWNAKIFRGTIRAGRSNYFVIQDPTTKQLFILFYRNLDYFTLG